MPELTSLSQSIQGKQRLFSRFHRISVIHSSLVDQNWVISLFLTPSQPRLIDQVWILWSPWEHGDGISPTWTWGLNWGNGDSPRKIQKRWCISFLHLICWNKVPWTGGLQITGIYSLTVLWARSLESRCRQDRAPSEGSRGGFFLASSNFWCYRESLVFLGCSCMPPISTSIITWPSPHVHLCPCIFTWPSYLPLWEAIGI